MGFFAYLYEISRMKKVYNFLFVRLSFSFVGRYRKTVLHVFILLHKRQLFIMLDVKERCGRYKVIKVILAAGHLKIFDD